MSQTDFDEFFPHLNSWGKSVRACVQLYFATKVDNRWLLRFGRIAFLPDVWANGAAHVHLFDLRTPSIRAGRRYVEFELGGAEFEIARLLQEPLKLQIGDFHVDLGAGATSASYSYLPGHPGFSRAERIPALRVSAESWQSRPTMSKERIDLELRSSSIPFDGFEDLASDLNLPNGLLEGTLVPHYELLIQPPVTILPTSQIEGRTAHIEIKAAPGVETAAVSIGVKLFTGHGILRLQIPPNQIEWRNEGAALTGSARIDAGASIHGVCFVSYEGAFVTRWWIRDLSRSFNSLLPIHKAFDPKGVIGASFFTDKADVFELRIALLLQLLGVRILQYGKVQQLTDAPDAIAVAGDDLFVIECTLGDIGKEGKLYNLYKRTETVKECVARAGLHFRYVLPVAITAMARNSTAAYWSRAHSWGIALLCREDIEALLNEVEAAPEPAKFYERMFGQIPAGE
jgi:hypothetical protein